MDKTYVKGGQIRTVQTSAQQVALEFDGWREARPADTESITEAPAVTEDGHEPAPDVPDDQEQTSSASPPAVPKAVGRRGGKTGSA